MSTRRVAALSLPVFLFACLAIAASLRAQDTVTFQLDETGVHPVVVLRFALESSVDRQAQARRSAATTQKKANHQLLNSGLCHHSQWTMASASPREAPPVPPGEITPAQYFGIGAQAAP